MTLRSYHMQAKFDVVRQKIFLLCKSHAGVLEAIYFLLIESMHWSRSPAGPS